MFNIILLLIKNLFNKSKKVSTDYGWVESPVDFRDFQFGAISELVPLPEEYKTPFVLRISDQTNKPMCVGYAGATIKELMERKERNFMDFDGDWIYNQAKKYDGMPDTAGTYFRMALQVMQKIGTKPLDRTEAEAGNYKIGGYARVEPNLDAIKQAIYQNGAVLAGFKISNEGWNTPFINPPRTGETTYGHAVATCVGFNKNYIIFQNSWGKDFGDNGYGYLDRNYPIIEAWAILTDLPNLPNLTTKPKYVFNNNLSIGMSTPEIKILQEFYKWIGVFPPAQETTEYFGNITLAATIVYQKRYNIPATGYIGLLTRTKINEQINDVNI